MTINRYLADGSTTDLSITWGSASAVGYAAAVDSLGDVFAAGTDGSDAVVLQYSVPPAPAILGLPGGGITNNATPTISGTAVAGSTVTI